MSNDPCEDYGCERPLEAHSHVGIQPHLRRVFDHGTLIDGKTQDRIIVAVSNVEIFTTDHPLPGREFAPVRKARVRKKKPAAKPKAKAAPAVPHGGVPGIAFGSGGSDDPERTYEAKLAQDQAVCQMCGHKYVSHALGGGVCYMTPCICQQFWAIVPEVGPGL